MSRTAPRTVLVAVVVRTVTLVAAYLLFAAVLARSSSTDALGAGLLFFLLVVVVSGVWAGVDAVRRGPAAAAVTWLLTGVLTGLGLALAAPLTGADGVSSLDDLVSGAGFVVVLVVLPALVGVGAGAVWRRVRAV